MVLRLVLLLMAVGGTIGQWEYVDFQTGELPLLITVPHGGILTPGEIPDRSIDTIAFLNKQYCGNWSANETKCYYDHAYDMTAGCENNDGKCEVDISTDVNTMELAEELGNMIYNRTGKWPFFVAMKLKKTKLDVDIELDIGTFNHSKAVQAYGEYAEAIEQFKLMAGDKGLILDIRALPQDRTITELAYGLTKEELNCGQTCYDESKMSIQGLLGRVCPKPQCFVEVKNLTCGKELCDGMPAKYNYLGIEPPMENVTTPAPENVTVTAENVTAENCTLGNSTLGCENGTAENATLPPPTTMPPWEGLTCYNVSCIGLVAKTCYNFTCVENKNETLYCTDDWCDRTTPTADCLNTTCVDENPCFQLICENAIWVACTDYPCVDSYLHGTNSLGHLLLEEGYQAIPSSNHTSPGTQEYESGGRILRTFGSMSEGDYDVIQIEVPKEVRLGAMQRESYVSSLATAVAYFVQENYALELPGSTTPLPATRLPPTSTTEEPWQAGASGRMLSNITLNQDPGGSSHADAGPRGSIVLALVSVGALLWRYV